MATGEKPAKAIVGPPLAKMTRWEQELERASADFVGSMLRPFLDGFRRTPFSFGTSAPVMDLYEQNNQIVVKAELPGMEKDDVEIKFRNHQLSIKGQKKRTNKSRTKITIFSNALTGRSCLF